MLLLDRLVGFLKLPEAHEADLDSEHTIRLHRAILNGKPFLRDLYIDQYSHFEKSARAVAHLSGHILEMGSGAGFLKDRLTGLITSDVCPADGIDRVIDAAHLPFEPGELKAIFLLNVLHHLPNAEAFFHEADRCLVPGGQLVMVEPAATWLGKLVFHYLHHELFDDTATSWELPAGGGRMSGSNQALPSIIFGRDRLRFEKEFQKLKIRSIQTETLFCFLLSGGMSWRAMAPAWSYPLFRGLDRLLSFESSPFPLFQIIVVEKVS